MKEKQFSSSIASSRFEFEGASVSSFHPFLLKRQQLTSRLLSYAEAMSAGSRAEAEGSCLAASLELAAYAQDLGFSPRLVMWRVVGDPAYRDHWAVAIESKLVIDPTRVQVDGITDILHAISDYPPNYSVPRLYPYTSVVHSAVSTVKSGRRISGRFMLGLRWRIFCYELIRAREKRDWSDLGLAVSMLWHFCTRYPVHHVRRSLESRLQRLQ